MTTLIESIRQNLNPILQVRDDLGAEKQLQFIVTRTWSGSSPGDGNPVDSKIAILPSGALIDLSHDKRVREGGNFKSGDILLKMVSKQTFPLESEIDNSTAAKNIEKFYMLGTRLYTVVTIVEDYVWWNVHLRKHNKSATFFP